MSESLEKPLILVVEDDIGIYENLRLLLEFNDYKVKIAENGKSALNVLLKLQNLSIVPALILSDIIMPEMNGYDFFRSVSMNPNWNKIPFIFLSALSYPEDIQLAKSLGVDDYITKPFKEEELIDSIEDKLEKNNKIEMANNYDKNFNLKSFFNENNSLIMFHISLNFENEIKIISTYPKAKDFEKFTTFVSKKFIDSDNIKLEPNMDDLNQIFIYTDFNNLNIQGSFLVDTKTKEYREKYILGVLSDNMSYFDSLNIKKILKQISVFINTDKQWNEELYYQKLVQLFRIKNEMFNHFTFDNMVDSHSAIK